SKRLQRVTQWMSCTFELRGSSLNACQSSSSSSSTSPCTRSDHVSRFVSGTDPACSTGHLSVRYWPGGRRPASKPASRTFFSALARNTRPRLIGMGSVATRAYVRPRAYVRVAGPDAADLLQRLVSNDVLAGESCEALLLTPKGRVIAPLLVWRRGDDDFLVLTEPELGDVVLAHLRRMRLASKCEVEPEEHTSAIVLDGGGGIPTRDYGVPAVEVLDVAGEPPGGFMEDGELERLRILARTPRWGTE